MPRYRCWLDISYLKNLKASPKLIYLVQYYILRDVQGAWQHFTNGQCII